MACDTRSSVAWADPDALAATRFIPIQEMLEISAKSGGVELPEPVTMGTSIVLSDCVNEHVLAWHRVVSPAGSFRRVLSDPRVGSGRGPGLVWGQQSAAGCVPRRIEESYRNG